MPPPWAPDDMICWTFASPLIDGNISSKMYRLDRRAHSVRTMHLSKLTSKSNSERERVRKRRTKLPMIHRKPTDSKKAEYDRIITRLINEDKDKPGYVIWSVGDTFVRVVDVIKQVAETSLEDISPKQKQCYITQETWDKHI